MVETEIYCLYYKTSHIHKYLFSLLNCMKVNGLLMEELTHDGSDSTVSQEYFYNCGDINCCELIL